MFYFLHQICSAASNGSTITLWFSAPNQVVIPNLGLAFHPLTSFYLSACLEGSFLNPWASPLPWPSLRPPVSFTQTKRQNAFPAKGQRVNVFGSVGHTVMLQLPNLAVLAGKWPPTKQACVWLGSGETLFMDNEIWIAYTFIDHKILSSFWFFSTIYKFCVYIYILYICYILHS